MVSFIRRFVVIGSKDKKLSNKIHDFFFRGMDAHDQNYNPR